jgi:hypothetical protein
MARAPAGSSVQTLLFPRDRFTVDAAKAWARSRSWRASDVDVTDAFIHLRQEDPSRYKRLRTVPFGGSGIEARVGWP